MESDYQENPTELIADKVRSSKSEILRILFYKRDYIKDRTALIELNDYSVALVKSILISDISDKSTLTSDQTYLESIYLVLFHI